MLEETRVPASVPGRYVYVIDDDRAVRIALSLQLGSMEFETRPFSCAEDFLSELDHFEPGCVLLDVRMPGKDGVTVLGEMVARCRAWPTIIMTGHAEVRVAVRAMKLGAIEFLEKPFRDDDLVAALTRGFAALENLRAVSDREREARRRLTGLTGRERLVFDAILDGLSNKEMAAAFQLSPRTVEMHRANLMRRTGTRKVAELHSLAVAAGYSKLGGPSSARLHAE